MLTADVSEEELEIRELPRHVLEGEELTLREEFYPWGFPLEVHTNAREVLTQCAAMWGKFRKKYDTEPMRADVLVTEGGASECPPTPVYRVMTPLLMTVADAENYCVVDMESCRSTVVMTQAALSHPLYAQYFLLAMPASCVSVRYVTPVHAGCVAFDGRGVLLCGESGAGKSTLSYACARAGWTYVSDDASFLLHGKKSRVVMGNCHQVRFRPSAAELFRELQGLEMTPRAAGKPSIELPIAPITEIHRAEEAQVDFIIFLNRNWDGSPELAPYSKDAARALMRQILYAPPKARLMQCREIERLLTAEIFELRYTDLDAAIERLRLLVAEGR